MKIAILSRKPQLYSTSRLVAAGEERGHEVKVVDYLRCYMNITARNPQVMYQGEVLEPFDAVIPRIGAGHTFYGTAVVRQFEMLGTWSLNESQSISRSRDKLRAMQLLSRLDIDLPITGFAHDIGDIEGLIATVGGAPLIVKLVEGTQGVGVVLAETSKAAESVIAAFRQLDANILVQEFIAEARGVDLRAFVVGNKVVASMRRTAADPGEFRANLHRGGTADAVKLTPQERKMSVRAAKALGLRVAGVDLLRSDRGPLLLEINSSPGLEGIERASGKDVGGAIIEYIEKNARPGETADRVTG